MNLKGEHIYLRALEPEDLDFVHDIENNVEFWELGNTQTPFSKYILKKYIENATKDIYEVKQLRLVICLKSGESIGLIDLFDFDFKNRRAGVGILIKNPKNRNRGFGKEALKILTDYSFNVLHLHQLYANVYIDNANSLKLFKSLGFIEAGLKKDWSYNGFSYRDVYLLQKLNT